MRHKVYEISLMRHSYHFLSKKNNFFPISNMVGFKTEVIITSFFSLDQFGYVAT